MSPGFLNTVQIPLVVGRDFTWEDTYRKLPVAIVSENVAREYWPTPEDAIGKRIRVSSKDDWREIVGVTGGVYDDGVNQKPTKAAYWPLMRSNFESNSLSVQRGVAYAIRSRRAGSEALMAAVRQAVWSADADLPVAEAHTAGYFYRKSLARTSVLTRMFVRQGMLLTSIGVVAGLFVSFGVMRLMSSLLFGVKAMDPLTYTAVSCGLAATAFLACYRRNENANHARNYSMTSPKPASFLPSSWFL